MEVEQTKRSRRLWSHNETLTLLKCYSKRKAEFEHPRKKKFAYENLLVDLTCLGALEEPTTAEMLETKIKSLLKAYKACIANKSRTGFPPSVVPFLQQMEDIFGAKPIIENEHSSNSTVMDYSVAYYAEVEKLSAHPAHNEFPPATLPSTHPAHSEFLPASSLSTSATSSIPLGVPTSPKPQSSKKGGKKRKISSLRQSSLAKTNALSGRRNDLLAKLIETMRKQHQQSEFAKERRHQEKLNLMRELFKK